MKNFQFFLTHSVLSLRLLRFLLSNIAVVVTDDYGSRAWSWRILLSVS